MQPLSQPGTTALGVGQKLSHQPAQCGAGAATAQNTILNRICHRAQKPTPPLSPSLAGF